MKISLHYYSGAGNTEFIAKRMAKSFEDNFCSIHITRVTADNIKTTIEDFDILGIGFPIYFRDAPELIYDLVRNLDGKSKSIFFFATKGLYSGNAVKNIMAFSITQNFQPIGSIEFFMPGTDFLTLFAKKSSHTEKLLKRIHSRDIDNKIKNFAARIQNSLPAKIPYKKWYTFFDEYTVKKLERMYDNHHKNYIDQFYSNPEICIECMACTRGCPRNNITFDGHIKFGTNCDVCFRCINHCPPESIQIGNITKGNARYNKVELL
ncbi:MAG: hypothetical protein GY710_20280 [Desulfobacteraceae bacterium]|nr:hypothetical protein [Desulfobacteraceae bacterium]